MKPIRIFNMAYDDTPMKGIIMDDYTYIKVAVQDAHSGDILLYGPNEKKYDILGIDKTQFKKVGLYVALCENNEERIAYWTTYYVNDYIAILRPKG